MRNFLANRQSGFTLLEVVFAVGILAIGMLGYTSLKISNRYSWFFAKNLSQAVQLTGANLESLLMSGYNDVGWMSAGDHGVIVNADGTIADPTVTKGVNDAGRIPSVSYINLDLPANQALDLGNTGKSVVENSQRFTASKVSWTVKEHCPSELSKLVTYTTEWSGGNNNLVITQVQVRP